MTDARARLAGCAVALLLALAPGFASADIPTGSFEFQLAGANSLWMGGDVDTHEDADGFCASFGAEFEYVELCNYELTVDGGGKIGGHVEFIGWIGGARVAIEGPIKGAQRGNNRSGITRASFAIRLVGTASRNGFAQSTSLSLKLIAQIDAGGVMNGTWTQKICKEGAPCETSSWPVGPTTWNDGNWTLALDVEHLGDGELGGSARIQFGDGTFCDFALAGSYDAKKDATDLKLSPVSPRCAGGSLRLRSVAIPSRNPAAEFNALLQYKLFGVSGLTLVGTHSTALFHPRANLSPPSSSLGSGSSGVTATITFIQLPPPPIPTVTQTPVESSESAGLIVLGVLPDSMIFQPLQSAAPSEPQGF